MTILDHFCPITSVVGLIEADLQTVAKAAVKILEDSARRTAGLLRSKDESAGTSFHLKPVAGTLEAALQNLVPLSSIVTRFLLLGTSAPNWTACFNNARMPASDINLIRCLSVELKTRTVLSICQDETIHQVDERTWKGAYGAYVFRLFHGSLTPLRTVEIVHYEDGWTFEQTGAPLDFEKLERYAARKKRDRLDCALLREYLGSLGLHPFEDSFYSTRGSIDGSVIVREDSDDTIRNRIQFYSLEEAITRRLGDR